MLKKFLFNSLLAGLLLACVLSVPALLLLASCAHEQSPSHTVNTVADSVFPVRYYTDEARGRSQSCSGFYIAPHLLVTSATLLPANQALETDRLALMNETFFGGVWDREVAEIPYFSREEGLLILKTKEAGRPIPLAETMNDEELQVIGFDFVSYLQGRVIARQWQKSAWFTPESLQDEAITGGQLPWPSINLAVPPGGCGAPILNKSGRAVGLSHLVRPNQTLIIPAWRIIAARKKIGSGS